MFCERNEIKLWVVKQAPETGVLRPARELFSYSVGRTGNLPDLRYSRLDHQIRQEKSEEIFQRKVFRNVSFLDPAPFLFDSNGMTINYLDGRSVYRDNDHLTKWGLELLRPLVAEAMREMQLQEGLYSLGALPTQHK